MKKEVLILGDGLLGSELVRQTDWDYISRKKDGFDIRDEKSYHKFFIESYEGVVFWKKYDIIVNCIGYTDTYSSDRDSHWDINYNSVYKLTEFCNKNNIKMVHISTDNLYAGNFKKNVSEDDVPVHAENWYTYTKLLGDSIVQLLSKNYLICRCTHKPYPFPHKSVYIDKVGNFDYVHIIAGLIVELINKDASGIYNVGTQLKTMHELVKKDFPDIPVIHTPVEVSKDTSMSIDKLNKFLNK